MSNIPPPPSAMPPPPPPPGGNPPPPPPSVVLDPQLEREQNQAKRDAKAEAERNRRAGLKQAKRDAKTEKLEAARIRSAVQLHEMVQVRIQCQYLGGWPSHPNPHLGAIEFSNACLAVPSLGDDFRFEWDDISGMSIEGPDQAEKRLTATRLVAVGVFAFAAKKTTSSAYVQVDVGGHSAGFMVPQTSAGELRAKLGVWIAKLPTPPPPPAPTAPPAGFSVADELKKLVELRDMGALTEGEFGAQKARLLG